MRVQSVSNYKLWITTAGLALLFISGCHSNSPMYFEAQIESCPPESTILPTRAKGNGWTIEADGKTEECGGVNRYWIWEDEKKKNRLGANGIFARINVGKTCTLQIVTQFPSSCQERQDDACKKAFEQERVILEAFAKILLGEVKAKPILPITQGEFLESGTSIKKYCP